MSEADEGILVIAVYVFVITVFTLPFVITYLFVRINRIINRATKILDYVAESEEEARKYHE